jgi:hypothetical protein
MPGKGWLRLNSNTMLKSEDVASVTGNHAARKPEQVIPAGAKCLAGAAVETTVIFQRTCWP